MKRTVSMLAAFFLLVPLVVDAQVEKGNWFLNGASNLAVNAGKWNYKVDGDKQEGYKMMSFNFRPYIGYAVIDRLPVGIFLEGEISSYKYPDDDKETFTIVAIGPFVRYYFGDLNNFMPFAEGSVGFGTYRFKDFDGDVSKEGYFAYRLGAGFSYFFNQYVGLDLFLGYGHQVYTDKDTGEGGDFKSIYGYFDASLGIVISLGR